MRYYTTCADCRKYVTNFESVEHRASEKSFWALIGYEVGAKYTLCFACNEHQKRKGG